MSGCDCEIEVKDKSERKILIPLFLINALMFFVEFFWGWLGESTGLIADSLDMLADAMVYAVAFYVAGKSAAAKAGSATLSGLLQLVLGVGVLSDVLRRTIFGSEPRSEIMIWISLLALAANIICLVLLTRHKNGEVHMRATWIFTKNDVIANAGVIVAGVLVGLLNSPVPDLAAGAIIAGIIVKDSFTIFREAKEARRSTCETKSA